MRILIANRGEIAVRIARTACRLGLGSITVYADSDRDALHVAAGDESFPLGCDEDSPYLRADVLIDAARRTGADAVHPGYGFLSESPEFARQVVAAGLTWIGPSAETIEAMGSKQDARVHATTAGVPVLPGILVDDGLVEEAAAQVGFPLMVKASRGGGGMGLRVVRDTTGLAQALAEARQQAERAFGDGALILERFLERPRHVEVQLVADRQGTVVAIGDRDCSLQRRHQKLVEEAPAPRLPTETRSSLHSAAERLGRAIGYDSVGTAEFLLDEVSGQFFFLEMNTRLQVEHTVTEEVTGLDLVELQIRAARGEQLAPLLEGVTTSGCAIEVRVTAEDAWAGFLPSSGRIERYRPPHGVRMDSGIEEGSEVSSRYDPLLLKVVVHERSRQAAVSRLDAALRDLDIRGVGTPLDHLVAAVASAPFRAEEITTRLLEEEAAQPVLPDDAYVASAAWLSMQEWVTPSGATGPWRQLGDWRLIGAAPVRSVVLVGPAGQRREVRLQELPGAADAPRWRAGLDADALAAEVELLRDGRVRVSPAGSKSMPGERGSARVYRCRRHGDEIVVDRPGQRVTLEVAPAEVLVREGATAGGDHDGSVRSPFPATVVEISAHDGEQVTAGSVLVVVEAMKMLHSLTAPFDGVVAGIGARVGETVQSQQVLATVRREST